MHTPTARFDAIILGGGPAGCTCAAWLEMLGFDCAIVDRRAQLGGLQNDSPYVNGWIPLISRDWRGEDVARALAQDIAGRNVEVLTGHDVVAVSSADWASGPHQDAEGGLRVALEGGAALTAPVVVMATGVAPRTGGLRADSRILIGPGHDIANTDFAGKRVAILGGGDNAFENYLFVKAGGASRAAIFARSIRARRSFTSQVAHVDVSVGPYQVDADALVVNGEPFDLLLVLYGWSPQLPALIGIDLSVDGRGFLGTDADCRTSRPDIFAIGEVARRMHPCCLTAMADGVVAAKAIQQRLEATAFQPR